VTERRIAHLDMDAFYASCELGRRPELRGRPIAIGGRGDPTRRGVVTTASYEARAFGVRSGMALRTAAELCPDCLFLPVDFDLYRDYSRRFKAALRKITDRIEDRGIDEVYLDLTGLEGVERDRGAWLARQLKNCVQQATGLTCSVGLAPNKLLAKIASDLNKPDGLTVIEMDDLERTIWPLAAGRINGIGPKSQQRLTALGIHSIGDLAQASPALLQRHFGERHARWMIDCAQGRDERALVTESSPKSRSRETTFERNLHPRTDWHALAAELARLSRELARELALRGYRSRTIGVKVRFDDFRIVTRDLSLAQPTDEEVAVRRAAFECLARIALDRRIRLLGVRAGTLSHRDDPITREGSPKVNVRKDAATQGKGVAAPGQMAAQQHLPLFDEQV
jgi:DNA polymerase IV